MTWLYINKKISIYLRFVLCTIGSIAAQLPLALFSTFGSTPGGKFLTKLNNLRLDSISSLFSLSLELLYLCFASLRSAFFIIKRIFAMSGRKYPAFNWSWNFIRGLSNLNSSPLNSFCNVRAFSCSSFSGNFGRKRFKCCLLVSESEFHVCGESSSWNTSRCSQRPCGSCILTFSLNWAVSNVSSSEDSVEQSDVEFSSELLSLSIIYFCETSEHRVNLVITLFVFM